MREVKENRGDGGDEEYQTCPGCGLPHKPDVAHCSYCDTKLPGKATVSEKIRRSIESAKWRYKLKKPGAEQSLAKMLGEKLLLTIVAVALSIVGALFLYWAVTTSAFSHFLIGALCMIYGVKAFMTLSGKG